MGEEMVEAGDSAGPLGSVRGGCMKNQLHILRNQQGTSIFNLLAAMAMISVLSTTAISNLKVVENPLADASFSMNHYLRLVRSRSISQTTFILLRPLSNTHVEAFSGDTCDKAVTNLDDLRYEFPDETALATTDWEVCFTPRGLADNTVTFDMNDKRGYSRTVEVALGGGSRIQ